MVLNPLNSSNLEQLALKWLIIDFITSYAQLYSIFLSNHGFH